MLPPPTKDTSELLWDPAFGIVNPQVRLDAFLKVKDRGATTEQAAVQEVRDFTCL